MARRVETLDYYVEQALHSFIDNPVAPVSLPMSQHTLVTGSQSGYLTGRILYRFANRAFSHAPEVLARHEIDSKISILHDMTIVSASGTREVVPLAHYALEKGLPVHAIVCNPQSELCRNCSQYKDFSLTVVPAIKEPPTVNTATYGNMIQMVTGEDPAELLQMIASLRQPRRPYRDFSAFTFIFPDSMPEVAAMVDWKLRGEKIGRCAGSMSVYLTNFMHGAGVTDAEKELYVTVGLSPEEEQVFGQILEGVPPERKHIINLPEGLGPLGYMLAGYTIVGHIQAGYPAFQERIVTYSKKAQNWRRLSPTGEQ